MSGAECLLKWKSPPKDGLELLRVACYCRTPQIPVSLYKFGSATTTMVANDIGYDNSGTAKMLKWICKMGLAKRKGNEYSLTDKGKMCAESLSAIFDYVESSQASKHLNLTTTTEKAEATQ